MLYVRRILTLFLLFTTGAAFAQTGDQKPLIQFVSIVRSLDSNRVVPYANITNKTQGVVYSANYQGYLAAIVHPGDTLQVTAIGYAPQQFAVPLQVTDQKFTKMVHLAPQAVHLPDITILPWATSEELKQYILGMRIADDELEVARKNLSPDKVSLLVNTLPLNGAEINARNVRNGFYNMSTKNMVSTSNYLSPLAWYAFVKSIIDGDQAKSKK